MSLTRATTFAAAHSVALQVMARGAAVLMSILFTAIAVPPSPVSAMEAGEFSDGTGVYRFESGNEITLFGTHPMFEFYGEQVHLVPDGEDRYVADAEPFEVITFIRDAHRSVTAIRFARPGEPAEIADRMEPYKERAVTFSSADAHLAGSLFLPTGPGPHPGIAIVHGAGPDTRENYRLIASSLARRGVAALIYDKRGIGESTGDFPSATFDNLTDDALAAVGRLRAESSVDPDRVGLAGFSQGAWIIARAAVASDEVAFLVAVSPAGFPPVEAADWLTGSMLAVRGFGERTIATSEKLWQMMYSSLDLVDAGVIEPMPSVPGFWFHALDPYLETVGLWEQVHQPVLALWGELDCQVPAHDSLAALRGALVRGPNQTHHLQILPSADHGMALAGACEREIGATHGGRRYYADGYLAAPAEWIRSLERKAGEQVVVLPRERASSPLGWHQSTAGDIAWPATLLPQVVVLPIMLTLFAGLAVAWLVRRIVATMRRRETRPEPAGRLWAVVGLVGTAATLSGVLALVELLSLGGILSAPFVGDGPVAGVTVIYAIACVLATTTVALGVLAITVSARQQTLVAFRPAVGLLAVGLLTAWAGYWGFLPLPGLA